MMVRNPYVVPSEGFILLSLFGLALWIFLGPPTLFKGLDNLFPRVVMGTSCQLQIFARFVSLDSMFPLLCGSLSSAVILCPPFIVIESLYSLVISFTDSLV